jgi:hypothetical protein
MGVAKDADLDKILTGDVFKQQNSGLGFSKADAKGFVTITNETGNQLA